MKLGAFQCTFCVLRNSLFIKWNKKQETEERNHPSPVSPKPPIKKSKLNDFSFTFSLKYIMVKIGSLPVNLVKKTEPRSSLLKYMLILANLNPLRKLAVAKLSMLQLKIENLKEKNNKKHLWKRVIFAV